jgi:thioredoxin 1
MMEKDDSMNDAMQKDEGAMMEKDTMMTKGSYEAYAPEKLTKANEGDVVLFFRAAWCPTCKVLDADLKAKMNTIPSGLTILDVNYDTETSLKQKYGVTYQHTLVQVDASGNMITKWSGGQTLASIVANVR